MDISFSTEQLKQLCEESKRATKKLGPDSADKLRRRLADIRAANVVSDLVTGKPHPLRGSFAEHLGLSLAGGDRLVVAPDIEPIPRKPDGSVDWTRVTKVRVVYVGDYHD